MDQVSAEDIENWIVASIAAFTHIAPAAVARDESFENYGIDSAKAIALMVDLEDMLQLPDELPLELLFEANSIREAAANIAAAIAANAAITTSANGT